MRRRDDGDLKEPLKEPGYEEYAQATIKEKETRRPIRVCKVEKMKGCRYANRGFVLGIGIVSLFLWFLSTNNLYTYFALYLSESLTSNLIISIANVVTFTIFVYFVASVIKAKEIDIKTVIILFSVVVVSNVLVFIFFPIPIS